MAETKTLTLTAQKGDTLGDVFSFIQMSFPDIQERANEFKVTRGAAPFMGSGEAPIAEIHVVLPIEDQETLRFYEDMLKMLAERGAEVTILINGKRYQPQD